MRVAVVLLGVMLVSLIPVIPASGDHPSLVPHPPVDITSNSDFGVTQGPFCIPNVANGVVGGCGTETNPWRIEGWLFVAPLGVGSLPGVSITIQGTDAHVLITDNHFVRDALKIRGANNIRFESNQVDLGDAVRAIDMPPERSGNIIIRGNTIDAVINGVYILGRAPAPIHDVRIEGNDITGASEEAVFLSAVTGLRIRENVITQNSAGILCASSTCSGRIQSNLIGENSGTAIESRFGSFHGRITENVIRDNHRGFTGILCSHEPDGVYAPFENNNIHGNEDWGIRIEGCASDARNNWWGHESGPSGLGDGEGDAVLLDAGDVLWDPWLTALNPNAGP